ncbi:YqaE/Pmp3 family membrane protein [Sporobolomyces salmoneus]|uniref:YqaE/Pmp3 family membrane protein n=1 Tax=Sporobolomyces salmoneus TaxID=183962 RepID=UPI00317B93C1
MARTSDILLILVAILFPPAAAGILTGCSCDLLINIALTMLGYIPGHLHAFWLIYKNAQAEERYGKGGFQYLGNGEYAPVAAPPAYGHSQPAYGQGGGYGATQ